MMGPLRSAVRRGLTTTGAVWLLLTLSACIDPNQIGVQDYGSIYGVVLTAKNQPIAGALVSAAGYQARSDPNGGFTLRVPIGPQTVSVIAPGFKTVTQDVQVLKNQSSPINTSDPYIRLAPTVDVPGSAYPPAPVRSPSAAATATPVPVSSASPAATAIPGAAASSVPAPSPSA